jgi:3-hydroxyacyl-CoA dehydrogenase
MSEGLYVRRAAVLGAGVMGAQIAAHLANAGVEALLFELPAPGDNPNANVEKAIAGLKKLQPSPLGVPEVAEQIIPANYDQHLELLAGCDLIIEAIAERLDWKRELYAKIAPLVPPTAILASNTSGLSINSLAEVLPEQLRHRFCGVHFFNPPRYMHLVELIAGAATEPQLLDNLESFLVTTLGKGVIRAKDTPNFIANRIGVFSMFATMHQAARFGIPFDVVDALTGPALGRPKSATFRTADVVGLDTLVHVVEGSAQANDPWREYLRAPAWLQQLIERKALGQKSGAGVYRKAGREIQVLDLEAGDYRRSKPEVAPEVQAILKERDPAAKLKALRESPHPQAQFLWAIHRDVFHYAAHLLAEIADNARDVDLAIRWGFGWSVGPFETWQAAGWKAVAGWIQEDIQAGRAMSDTPLPQWVDKIDAPHTAAGSYSAAADSYRPRSTLPIYQRQLFPVQVLGETPPKAGETVWETPAVRLWSLDGEVAILSIRTKMHAVGNDVLDGIQEAVARAEQGFRALVFWHPDEPFSAGANLQQVTETVQASNFDALAATVAKFQQTSACLRYARIPVVAAPRGLALGGGCEFVMHADRVVAGFETYMGLVEVGVGLIPAGGGCKEFAQRAAEQTPNGDLLPFIKNAFETIALGKVAKSAPEAKKLGLLRPSDLVVMNPNEQLFVALSQARALADAGYRPPLPKKVPAAGRGVSATLKAGLVNMLEGGFISPYDYKIGSAVAEALCGGDVDGGIEVDETWLLDVERRLFMELLRNGETQERIVHMLKTGKPLRN